MELENRAVLTNLSQRCLNAISYLRWLLEPVKHLTQVDVPGEVVSLGQCGLLRVTWQRKTLTAFPSHADNIKPMNTKLPLYSAILSTAIHEKCISPLRIRDGGGGKAFFIRCASGLVKIHQVF